MDKDFHKTEIYCPPKREPRRVIINKRLARERNLSEETIKKIETLHKEREELFIIMEEFVYNRKILMNLYEEWKTIEFCLQDLWGFPRDERFHRFWDIPMCKCPIFDNLDAIGTDYAVYNMDCPIHGS